MTEHWLPGSPPVPLTLRRSARARRMTLRVSQLDGRVTLTLPRGVPLSEAIGFAQSRNAWIRGHLDAMPKEMRVEPGMEIPYCGDPLRIMTSPHKRPRLADGVLLVPGTGSTGPKVQGWLKARARENLAEASNRYAAMLGRSYLRMTLRDTRSRWGSCSSAGALMYSWRLIMAPRDVLEYVAAHEVAHLEEMNHSPAFWSLVERLYGPWEAPRRWLQDKGNGLHRYRFDGTP